MCRNTTLSVTNMRADFGSQTRPYVIDDEDQDVPQHPLPPRTRQVTDIWQRITEGPAICDRNLPTVEDTFLDEQIAREIAKLEAKYDEQEQQQRDVIDLTQDEEPKRSAPRRPANLPHGSSTRRHKPATIYRFGELELRVGDCIELKEPLGPWEIQFIVLTSIDDVGVTGKFVLRGVPYARARKVDGRLGTKQNEVCQIVEVDAGADDAYKPDVEVDAQQVLCLRDLHKTNALYPAFRFAGDPSWTSRSKQDQEDLGPLTCRWKMRLLYQGRKPWRYAGAMIHLMEEDVEDPRFRVSDRASRRDWRGADEPRASSVGRKFTFGDIFSGCGGVTRGAVMAGLEPTVSVDHWEIAHKSFQRNFPGALNYNDDVFHFITARTDRRSCRRVDILHLSPPCQFFAPCHTHQGPDDDRNTAALFACTECVMKLRPRLVLLEQTFGLADRHQGYFNALICGFTSLGYSIQWRVVPLVEYGLPQIRRRLIVIAACPGEKLPAWPAPTHGPRGSGLKPVVTEVAAFRQLRPDRTNLHDVRTARRLTAAPRDGDKPFSGTITCSGPPPGIHHHSGTRDFTLRELACLQGFPLEHVFEGNKTAIRKQIGNAFAPCVVKVLLTHLRQSLERSDAAEEASPSPPPPPPEIPRRPASPARSVTVDFSPPGSPVLTPSSGSSSSGSASGSSSSGSGSSLGKRKYKDVDDTPVKMASLAKRIQRIEFGEDEEEPEHEPDVVILLEKPPPNVVAWNNNNHRRKGNTTTSSAATATASGSGSGTADQPEEEVQTRSGAREWTPFPPVRGDGSVMSFPRGLWKLPVARASSADWEV